MRGAAIGGRGDMGLARAPAAAKELSALPLLPPVTCSVDSATERAIAAEARLRDYGQGDDEPTSSKALPSALAAFGQVGGGRCRGGAALPATAPLPAGGAVQLLGRRPPGWRGPRLRRRAGLPPHLVQRRGDRRQRRPGRPASARAPRLRPARR